MYKVLESSMLPRRWGLLCFLGRLETFPSQVIAHNQKCPGVSMHGSIRDLGAPSGVQAEDLVDWASMQLAADVDTFGPRLLEWVTAQRSAEPGFLEDDAWQGMLNSGYTLVIKPGSKAFPNAAPRDSEHNFNAGVQWNVASCDLFPRWISTVCAEVEGSDLKCISFNCTKGRHRSVAAAELLGPEQLWTKQAAAAVAPPRPSVAAAAALPTSRPGQWGWASVALGDVAVGFGRACRGWRRAN
eukprot:s3870_g12.t1